MLSIAIDRVKARYRIPRPALGEQPRLQRIVDDALTRVLEGAVEREGIGPDGYVCIRDVHAVATVRLREPDSALAAGVGDAIAVAIRRRLDEGSSSVVQYGSRAHALVDLASSAIGGDFSRSWAWTQVGIWRADFPLRADVTADLVVRALAKEPTHAAAVAAYLARERADRFGELIARATLRALDALARAAFAAAGGAGNPAARVTDGGGGTREAIDPDRRERQAWAWEQVARRVVTHSAIARVSIERFARAADEIPSALAALALLEVEPSAARGGVDTVQVLTAIERAMSLAARSHVARLPDTGEGHTQAADAQGQIQVTGRREESAVRLREGGSAVNTGERAGAAAGEPSTTEGRRPPRAAHDDRPRASQAADPTVDVVPDVRRLTSTGHGGLLYLVNLLPRIGLIEATGSDERWSDRGLRWVLHQLAMALAAIDPTDPAALVFAGLVPEAAPPSSLQDPPTDLERAALETLRATIARALRETLGGPAEPDAESDRALLDQVCRRRAQIIAEPGWIEARFSLEDVSLDIRRAGLDLNPEWVPWLGVVLRFVYA